MALHRLPVVAGVTLLAAICASPTRAVAPQIKDDGKFFGADAIKKANEQIRDIARRSGLDLLIETIATLPDDQAAKVKAMSPAERGEFFAKLARARREEAVVRGIYILVCREPPHVDVLVHMPRGGAFSPEDRQKLTSQLIHDFRDKHFDEGLAKAVKFVQEKLTANRQFPRD